MATDCMSREAAIRLAESGELRAEIYCDRRTGNFYKKMKRDILNIPAADVVEVVRCKDCIHAPLPGDCEGNDMEWPKIDGIYEDCTCPHFCGDNWYSTRPDPDGFCEKGERRESNLDTTKGDSHD